MRLGSALPIVALAITLGASATAGAASPGEAPDAAFERWNAAPVRLGARAMALDTRPAGPPGAAGAPTRLRVSENGRFLENDAGPFFWLGDTAWWILQRLTRQEIVEYLDNRRAKGFNVIQTIGVRPGGPAKSASVNGDQPLLNNNFATPNPVYWDEVEFIINEAARRNMYVALLPSWGKHMRANALNGRNGYAFGNWLGRRFANKTNLIWVLGGDIAAVRKSKKSKWDFRPRLRRIAEGISDGVNGNSAADGKSDYSTTLMTYHPGHRSDRWLHFEAWLDFNMIQSGHGEPERYRMIGPAYAKNPKKPVLDGEPWYEGMPRFFNPKNRPATDADARRSAYWSVLFGAAGHTYGHNIVFRFCVPTPKPCKWGTNTHWRDAMDAPGAGQMRHLRALIESRDMLSRVPDRTLVENSRSGDRHIVAARGNGYAFIYTPRGKTFAVRMGKIGGAKVKASWFNPRDGRSTAIGLFTNAGTRPFTPPREGVDWVLVLDSE